MAHMDCPEIKGQKKRFFVVTHT